MDFQLGRVLTNNSEVRGRNPLSSANSSRKPSIGSSGHSTPYYNKMDIDLDDAPAIGGSDNKCLELSYETEQEHDLRIGKATN